MDNYGSGGWGHGDRGNSGGGNEGGGGGYGGGQKQSWGGGGKPSWQGGGDKKPWQGKGKDDWKKPKPEEIDPTLYKPVFFTGNRDAPPEIIAKMKELMLWALDQGITVRTGGDGNIEEEIAKLAQSTNAEKLELILPWKEFNGFESALTWPIERAHAIAKMFHPTYDNLKKGVHGILAKNARNVMGHKMMSPVVALLVWTDDGVEQTRNVLASTGFAGHSIKIANAVGRPVFNLGNPTAEQRFRDFITSLAE